MVTTFLPKTSPFYWELGGLRAAFANEERSKGDIECLSLFHIFITRSLTPLSSRPPCPSFSFCCSYTYRMVSRMTALHIPHQFHSIWASTFLLLSLHSWATLLCSFQVACPCFHILYTVLVFFFCISVKIPWSGISCSAPAASCYAYSFVYINRCIILELWGSCPWSQTSSPGPLSP